MTFSSAPGGLGFSRSRRTGVILPTTSSPAEAIDGRAHSVVGRGLGRASGPTPTRDLSSPERGPVTRHIFLPAPNLGNYAAPEKTGRRRFIPPASTSSRLSPREAVVSLPGPAKSEFPLHPNPAAPGDLRLGRHTRRGPNILRCPPSPAGQFPGPAVVVLAQTVPPSQGHCPLELLPASWHNRGAGRREQHLLGL